MTNEQIKATLLSMGESKYKDFCSSLMPTVEKSRVIGIRTPKLRRFAKELSEYDGFLQDLPHRYFEENNLHAFLIEREGSFELCIKKLEAFLPYVDNWATCDSMKPKVLKTDLGKLLTYIEKWLNADEVYKVRYAINLLMSFYLDTVFDEKYHSLVAAVNRDEYYINMMRAWYFATALAKQYESTLPYIENNVLDIWTHNKTIQKSIESLRITNDQKQYLRSLKRAH